MIFLERTGPGSKPVLRNDNRQPTAHEPQISSSLHRVMQFVHLSHALTPPGGVRREAAVMQVRLFNDGAGLGPKGVPLSDTTIAAISSNEMQSEVFLGLHYSKEPQVVDFAPKEGTCKSSPRPTAVQLMLVRRVVGGR